MKALLALLLAAAPPVALLAASVDAQRAEHCPTDYRSVVGGVNLGGVDAFELSTRLSLTP